MTSQTSYVYDGLNRLTAETQTGALKAFSATYAYDDYGNRAGLTVDGVTTNYTYDANNRLLSNTDGTNTTTYTYDAQGNLTQSVLAVGDETHTVNCTYDNFNRLKKVSDNHGETVYTYDADGLRASKATNSSTERYVWDGDQLVVTLITHTPLYTGQIPDSGSVTGNNVELTAGRQYYVEVDGVVYSATAESNYVEVEEPTPLLDMADGETPEVPPAPPEGPPADFGAADTILSVAGVTISGYSSSQTVNVSAPAGTTVTLYARNPEASYNAYIRGLSLIAAQLDDKMYNYHYDAHGNVVQLVWGGGIVDRDYYYDAFGVEQNADDSDTNPFRYCGEQYDGETGNYYLRARYYTPGAGRFTQEDPARDGLNWYAYCSGNPVVFVDPSGMQDVLLRYIAEKNGADINPVPKKFLWFISYGLDRVDITLDGKTASYRGDIIQGRMIVDSDQFGADFGITDVEKLTHQPGDEFNTVEDAALAWGLTYNQRSINENTEYAGSIYRSNGRYTFTDPQRGTIDKSKPSMPSDIETLKAIIHAHAAYSDQYDSENFSAADVLIAIANKVPIYLSTPGGYLKRHNPNGVGGTAIETTLTDKLFKDPNFK